MLAERAPELSRADADQPAGGLAYRSAKRAMDLLVTLASLPVVIPVLLVLALAIVGTSPGRPFYRQLRAGKQGREFRMWKLRTMVPIAERIGPELTQASDPRITPIGRFLRRWSLDELPQVFDVLAGRMSLVGPRPELPSIVATYTPAQLDVLLVRPGLTGWSQIHGRDDLSVPRKLQLDREYIFSRSLRMDARILARTIPLVLSGSGIKR